MIVVWILVLSWLPVWTVHHPVLSPSVQGSQGSLSPRVNFYRKVFHGVLKSSRGSSVTLNEARN